MPGEALLASVVAYFAYRALQGSDTDAWLAAGYLGLAGGMRQSILILLFPLWLGSTIRGTRRVRTVVIGLAILALAVLAWFVPMIWLTGGLARYLEASRELADTVVRPTSVVGGPLRRDRPDVALPARIAPRRAGAAGPRRAPPALVRPPPRVGYARVVPARLDACRPCSSTPWCTSVRRATP